MLRALLMTYVWPPTGGVGVGRVLKLAKYLPRHGVKPSVLTVENPSVPLQDASMLKDVAPDLEVVKARTLEPSYAAKQAAWDAHRDTGGTARPTLRKRLVQQAVSFGKTLLVPDPQLLWQPGAQRALHQRFRSAERDDVLFVTAPPFSSFLAAPTTRAFARGAGIVLDYRDEWVTLRTQYEMLGGLNRIIGGPMEGGVLRTAHFVTTATDAFRESLLGHFPFLDPHRVITIENGFDPDDFPTNLDELPGPPDDRLVITYAGTLFVQNSPRGLIAGIRRLHEREPELAKLLRVRFIGRIVDTELKWFENTEGLGIERVGYIDKARIPYELAASHMVLCLLDEMPGAERIYPAKIFELMVQGRPCLTLSPEGALTGLVRTHQLGTVLPPRDEEAIAEELARALRTFRDGKLPIRSNPVDIEKYDRRVQAGLFADVFREAAKLAKR